MSYLLEITMYDHDRPPSTYTESPESEEEADKIISEYKKTSDFSYAVLYSVSVIKEY